MTCLKKIIIGFLALTFMSFITIGCGGNGTKNDDTSSPSSSTSSSEQKMEAKTYNDADINAMLSEVEGNGAAANKHYKGKNLRILGGHIQNIDSDLSYISIDGNSSSFSLVHVNCKIDANNEELQNAVIQLKKGQNVIVYGTVTEVGDIMGYTLNLDKIEDANHSISVTNEKNTTRPSSNAVLGKTEPAANPSASVAVPSSKSATPPAPDLSHWIKDSRTGIYLWNPEPAEGESIAWSGGYVTDGNIRYAEGTGVVTWYRNGEVIQIDEGGFSHGRHHGHFSHKFPSGRIIYSNWDHGRELD